MNIIKKGDIKKEIYIGTCKHCDSVVEYDKDEVIHTGHNFNNHHESIKPCPICHKAQIIVSKKQNIS